MSRRWRRERGSATLEIAVLGPVLLLLVFAVVQVALWAYARNLALAAAQEGVAAAAALGGRPHDGTARARVFLERAAADSLTGVEVHTTRVATDRVRVEVAGRSLSVLPGLPGITVRQAAESSLERFVPDGG